MKNNPDQKIKLTQILSSFLSPSLAIRWWLYQILIRIKLESKAKVTLLKTTHYLQTLTPISPLFPLLINQANGCYPFLLAIRPKVGKIYPKFISSPPEQSDGGCLIGSMLHWLPTDGPWYTGGDQWTTNKREQKNKINEQGQLEISKV